MEVDISKDILKRLEESFGEKIKSNKKIKYLLKKLENDEATYKEANEYAIELGQILAETYKENIKGNGIETIGIDMMQLVLKVLEGNMM